MGPAKSWTSATVPAHRAKERCRPQRSAPAARSGSPAPMHWPAMVVTAIPTAQQGMAAKVFTFSPTPAAAAAAVPWRLNHPVTSR